MNRLPHGVRDYLPAAAARRRQIVSSLSGEFIRWGYRAVITPIYEYDEVLSRGLGAPTKALRFVDSGEVLALRPDLTPQVARLVATRLHDEPGPIRLFYEGSVVRNAEELFQVGVELIDAAQPGGDLEAVSLLVSSLRAAGVGDFTLDLGHAAVVHAALSGLDGDEALHDALAKKDAARVEGLVANAKISAKRKKLIAALPSLYGGPEVLSRAKKLVEDPAAVDELARLIERVEKLDPGRAITVDLGEVRGFRYYTGTRFSAYARGAGRALAQGGRYDRVVERYGRPARATGFAVDVDGLAEVVRGSAPELPGVLVTGEPLAAAQLAQKLRQRGVRAVMELDEPPAPRLDRERLLAERAARMGLQHVVVVASKLKWFGESRGSGDERAALDALAPAR
jgi:ATP phosphoribosyltransferase regulatory subunit